MSRTFWLLAVVLWGSVLNAQSDGPLQPIPAGITVGLELSDSDLKLLVDMREEVLAISESERKAAGRTIIEKYLPRVESKVLRQRMILSLGDISSELGDEAAADRYFDEVSAIEGPYSYTAIKRTLRGLVSSGQMEEAFELIESELSGSSLALAQRHELQARYWQLLVAADRIEVLEASVVEFLRNSEPGDSQSNRQSFQYCLGVIAMIAESHPAKSIALLNAACEAFPALARMPTFLSEVAGIAMLSGDTDRAMHCRQEIIDKHNDSHLVPYQLLTLARHQADSGDVDRSAKLFEELLARNDVPDDLRKVAQSNLATYLALDAVDRGPEYIISSKLEESASVNRKLFVGFGLAVVFALGVYFLAKRRATD